MALARALALQTLRRDGKEITPLTIQREAITLLPMIGVDVPNTNNDSQVQTTRHRVRISPPQLILLAAWPGLCGRFTMPR